MSKNFQFLAKKSLHFTSSAPIRALWNVMPRFVMSQWSRVLDPTVPVVRPCCPVYSTAEDVRVYVLGNGRGLG